MATLRMTNDGYAQNDRCLLTTIANRRFIILTAPLVILSVAKDLGDSSLRSE
ncbi:hypothetical protein QUB08_23665 [Microcoleus sp. BR0-C5]